MEYKSAAFELNREPDADGNFEGYASVFGIVDQGLDVVEQGAFTKSLGGRKVRMLWQHDPTKVIGVWDEIKEDHRGLFVRGRVLKDVALGAEALALLRAGAIDSMSIGYETKQAVNEGGGSVRKLLEIDLWEVSLVTFPMLPDAVVTDVKKIGNIREIETILRDAGVPNAFAKLVAAYGFDGATKRLDVQRDAGGDVDSGDLKKLLNQITPLTEKITG